MLTTLAIFQPGVVVGYTTSANLIFCTDCKAASLETRGTIDHEKGYYLFPLPMTGDTSQHLKELVLNPTQVFEQIVLSVKENQDENDRVVGKGFVVNKLMETCFDNGVIHPKSYASSFAHS